VTLTRSQFVERVEHLAGLFAARGVAEGSTVTIGLPNSTGLVESLFAAWALGAVPQPISHRLPPLERGAIVDLANPSLVVGAPESEAAGRPALESVPQQLPPGSFTPGVSPVWKLVTSGGSTGRPKLIAATAPALFENVGGLGALVRMPPDGCVLVTGPVSHNAPFVVTAAGMLLGNHVVVMPWFDPAETLRLIDKHRVTWLFLVGGANVYPAEIEAALDEHPAVRSCCVIGLPDEDLGNIPYAIVELSEPVSDEDLVAHLRLRLAPYKLPRTIERAATPLRDDAGKVRRSALRAERIARLPTTR
jgi:acyl-CoA synthetase (AMP-forming)/AMP-acid ligase II